MMSCSEKVGTGQGPAFLLVLHVLANVVLAFGDVRNATMVSSHILVLPDLLCVASPCRG